MINRPLPGPPPPQAGGRDRGKVWLVLPRLLCQCQNVKKSRKTAHFQLILFCAGTVSFHKI